MKLYQRGKQKFVEFRTKFKNLHKIKIRQNELSNICYFLLKYSDSSNLFIF